VTSGAGAAIRYAALLMVRSRLGLAPLAALLVVLLGVFAYRPNDVGPTWALTALVSTPLVGWTVSLVARAEPPAARDIARAALGTPWRRAAAAGAVALAVASAVTAAMLLHPLALGAFDRPVRAADLAAAALAHLSCGLFGAALGLLASPPVCERAGNGAAVLLGALLAAVAVSQEVAWLGGPAAVSAALVAAAPGTLPAQLLARCAATWALTGAVVVLAGVLARRRR